MPKEQIEKGNLLAQQGDKQEIAVRTSGRKLAEYTVGVFFCKGLNT
jgi:hypothetical protein